MHTLLPLHIRLPVWLSDTGRRSRRKGSRRIGLRTICFLGCLLLYASVFPHGLQAGRHLNIVGLLAGAGGIGDQSYNDMTLAGIGRAQKDYQFKLLVQETDGSADSQERGLRTLLEQGAEVVVANGSGLGKLVERYSASYPGVYFLVNDFHLDGHANVVSTIFAHEEGAYLVGIVAAGMTESGSVAFIGGVDTPIIRSFLHGYRKGVASVSESVEVVVAFVSEDGNYSGFTNPGEGWKLANRLYDQGVDIIFSVAGLTGNGIIQAALERGRFVIGVDADQDHMAKGYVLTSMMKRLDQATYRELMAVFSGRFTPGVNHYGLANGGISLTPMTYTKHMFDRSLLEQIEQAREGIIEGRIQVTGEQ